MKKTITFLVFTMAFQISNAGVLPTSYLTIEALISAHKKQTTLLQERNKNEVANTGLQLTVSNITKKYNLIKKKMDGRIKSTYTTILFTKEAADIILTTKKITELEATFVSFATQNAKKNQ